MAWAIFVWVVGLNGTSLFILGAVTGLVFAPIFPLSFGFFNQRLNVVPMLIALLLCGSALGALIFQKVAGNNTYNENSPSKFVFFCSSGFVMDQNPNHFPILLIVCILMSILLYIVSNIVHIIHRRTTGEILAVPVNERFSKGISGEEQELDTYLRNQEQH